MLQLIATPLGNLGDITFRSIEALKSADAIVCEDTRRTLKLLSHYGIQKPLLSMPAFDEGRKLGPLLARLQAGETLALVSDAGSVAISDPGEKLVAAAIAAGVSVEVLPGPSAVVAAVQISGLPTGRFTFAGFLPRKGQERREAIDELGDLASTIVLYESPRRLGATLSELADAWGSARKAAVVRELTKMHEEVARGTLAELSARFSGEVLGEVTLVVEGLARTERPQPTEGEIQGAIARRSAEGLGTRALAKAVATELGLPAREIYRRILARSGSDRGS